MAWEVWLAFVAAAVVLLAIPGPTVLLVSSYALTQGRRVALATAAGVALGDLIAMTVSLAGLGEVIAASATLFAAVKWAGAAYLIWLGVRMIRSAPAADPGLPLPAAVAGRQAFGHAAAVTALNPKSIAFFIAFVPQFIDTTRPLGPQFAGLTATFVGLAALNALLYALIAAGLRQRLSRPRILRRLTLAGGGALIAMGAATAALRRAGA